MKKLLSLITVLFCTQSYLYADIVTSGVIGLRKPTTGFVDITQRYDAKINTNLDVIAATMTTISNKLDNVIASTGAFAASSDVTTRFNNVATDTSTIKTRLDNVATDTSTLKTRLDNVATDTATINNRFSNVATDTATIRTNINLGVLSVYDEGLVQGVATTINVVGANVSATNSGSTTTLTVSASASANSYPYDLILATWNHPNANGYFVNRDGFDLNLASVGLRGLTTSSTATARIFIMSGVYKVTGATIPAGAVVVCGSSVVFVDVGSLGSTIIDNYGDITGMKFDLSNRAFTGNKIVLKSFSKLRRYEVDGAQAQGGNGAAILSVKNGSNVIIECGWLKDPSTSATSLIYGDGSPFQVVNSSQVIFRNNLWTASPQNTGDSAAIGIMSSSYVYIQNNDFKYMDGGGIYIAAFTKAIHVTGNRWMDASINGSPNAGHFIGFPPMNAGSYITTGTVIANNYIEMTVNQTDPIIGYNTTAGQLVSGIVIENNTVTAMEGAGAGWTFLNIDSDGVNTIVKGNTVTRIGTFISDAGVGTKYTGLGNFKDGIEQ